MAASDGFRRLIEGVAPLFAGEAEVFRTYWDSPLRTRDTDRLEIRRHDEYDGKRQDHDGHFQP